MTKYHRVQGVVTPNGALHGTILEYSCNIGYRDTILPCLPRNRDHAFIIDYLKRNHIIVNYIFNIPCTFSLLHRW